MFKFKDEPTDERPQLIIVPMVDLMLFLLAFFVLIVGSSLPGLTLKTNPPETTQKSTIDVKRKVITVTIKENGDVYFENRKVNLDQLKVLLKVEMVKNPLVSVAINADKNAKVQRLVNVMDTLQEVGINSIGLVAKVKNENGR